MLKYSQIYQRVEAEAKHEKEFDRWANKMVVFTNRPYIDTYLFVVNIGYLLQRLAYSQFKIVIGRLPVPRSRCKIVLGSQWRSV
jgi:hypothetical protein